jgi:hypothetical protein
MHVPANRVTVENTLGMIAIKLSPIKWPQFVKSTVKRIGELAANEFTVPAVD